MRLYSLVSRTGKVKRGLLPWFKPPAAGAPTKYYGWTWDPTIERWVKTSEPSMTIRLEPEVYPKPTEPPIPERPAIVDGWEWSEVYECWEKRPAQRAGHYEVEPYPPKPDFLPTPETGFEVQGWYYSSRDKEWFKAECELRMIWVPDPHPEMPKYVPSTGTPTDVKGWSWSEDENAWVQVIYPERIIEFDAPATLPPGITQEAVFELFSWEQLFVEEVRVFVDQGYTLEAARRIARDNFDPLLRMLWAKQYAETQSIWQGTAESLEKIDVFLKEDIAVIGGLSVLAAVVGAAIGYIMQREIFPTEETITRYDKRGAYLFGPEDWSYAGIRAITEHGVQYYSGCGSIGTSYVRHKRGYGVGHKDTIDFPGGFVEEGWHAGRFVKYTWEYWTLEYVGFLMHSTTNLYRLQGSADPEFLPEYSFMLDDEHVCRNFQEEYL